LHAIGFGDLPFRVVQGDSHRHSIGFHSDRAADGELRVLL
jgi:hypothetical protein